MSPPSKLKVKAYTYEEIAKHNRENDCWVVINGNVCDMTQWLPENEEDRKICLAGAGIDFHTEQELFCGRIFIFCNDLWNSGSLKILLQMQTKAKQICYFGINNNFL